MAVKNVVFKITANTGTFVKDIKAATAAVDALNKSVLNVNRSAESLNTSLSSLPGVVSKLNTSLDTTGRKAKDNFAQANKQVQQTAKETNKTSDAVSNFSTVLSQARNIIGKAFVATSLIEFGKQAVLAAGEYQKLNVAFTTFLGSASLAKQTLAELQQFAQTTPFTAQETQQASRVLLAYGFNAKQLLPILTQLGSISSGTQIPLQQIALVFGQVKAAGKLMGQDLLQLVNAGFNPLQEISERTGESMASLRKRMAEGKISADDIQESFIAATIAGGRFYNLNEEIGKTLPGRLSSLADVFQVLVRNIGEGLVPSVSRLVEVLIQLTNAANKLQPLFENAGKGLNEFASAVEFVVNIIPKSLDYIGELNEKLKQTGILGQAISFAFESGFKILGKVFGFVKEQSDDASFAYRDSVKGFEIANESTEKSVDSLIAALEKQKAILAGTTFEEARRAKLVEQFNKQYKQYGVQIKNLEDERAFIIKLEKAYQDLLERISNATKRTEFKKELDIVNAEYTKLLEQERLVPDYAKKSYTELLKINRDTALKLRLELSRLKNLDLDLGAGDGGRAKRQAKDLVQPVIDEFNKLSDEVTFLPTKLFDPKGEEENLAKIAILREKEDVKARDARAREQRDRLALLEKDFKDGIISQERYSKDKIAIEKGYDILLKKDLQKNEIEWQFQKLRIELQFAELRRQAVLDSIDYDAEYQLDVNERANEQLQEDSDRTFKAIETTWKKSVFRQRLDRLKSNYEEQKEILKADKATIDARNTAGYTEDIRKATDEKKSLQEFKAIEDKWRNIRGKAEADFKKKNKDLGEQYTEAEKNAVRARTEWIIGEYQMMFSGIADLSRQVTDAIVADLDRQINAQQNRVDKAKQIAEQGNAELLQEEEDKLNKLNQQRARYVRSQQIIIAAELIANASLAIAKTAGQTGAASPFTIPATIVALIAGLASVKARFANQGGFEKGGYTGDGQRKEVAGTVHKGEFVFTQEKTKKYRSLFEDIHKGRDPYLANGLGEKIVVINNHGMDDKLGRIEKAIKGQSRVALNIDERGIYGIVSSINYKNDRIRNKAR